jgi:hypothetical protein
MDNEFHDITATLKDEFLLQVNAFFGALLETRYGDWTEGLGACGDFGIDFKFGTVVHVHRYRRCMMEYEWAWHDGFGSDLSDGW